MSGMTESAKQSDPLRSRYYWKHLMNNHSLNYALCHISLLLCCCLMDWWPFQLSLLWWSTTAFWKCYAVTLPEISFTSLRCSKINFGSDWHKANFHLSSKCNSCLSVQQRCSWTIKYNQKHLSLSIVAFVCLSHLSINCQCNNTCDILNSRSLIVLRKQSHAWAMYKMSLHLHWSTSSLKFSDLILLFFMTLTRTEYGHLTVKTTLLSIHFHELDLSELKIMHKLLCALVVQKLHPWKSLISSVEIKGEWANRSKTGEQYDTQIHDSFQTILCLLAAFFCIRGRFQLFHGPQNIHVVQSIEFLQHKLHCSPHISATPRNTISKDKICYQKFWPRWTEYHVTPEVFKTLTRVLCVFPFPN